MIITTKVTNGTMTITVKTAITFQLPKEKECMKQFECDNSDWVLEAQANTVTYRRTQIFGLRGDTE